MLYRMTRAALFDSRVYEDVEADTGATTQAMIVVVLVALATGIGTLGAGGLSGFISGIVYGLISWAVWAYITYVIGTTLFRTPETDASWGELARTTGFAQSPGLLRVFGFIPVVELVIFYATSFWQIGTMIIAVRQALDYRSTWRALGVVLVGFIILSIIQVILYILLV